MFILCSGLEIYINAHPDVLLSVVHFKSNQWKQSEGLVKNFLSKLFISGKLSFWISKNVHWMCQLSSKVLIICWNTGNWHISFVIKKLKFPMETPSPPVFNPLWNPASFLTLAMKLHTLWWKPNIISNPSC